MLYTIGGKTPEVNAQQDQLLFNLKGLALLSKSAPTTPELNRFLGESLFATMTNVNFDESRFVEMNKEADKLISALPKTPQFEEWMKQKTTTPSLRVHDQPLDKDVIGMQEMITYGLKGMCAYADHARVLGNTDAAVDKFVINTLAALADPKKTLPELIQIALDVGRVNVSVLDMLDKGHNRHFGTPSPQAVKTLPRPSKHAILVSGHDLKVLENVLKATEGKDIDVYTHGEMLPAHGYPGLRKYNHLAGNWGGPWQQQKFDFSEFPGPILLTSNCLIEPRKAYKNRLYTSAVVGWPGCKHLSDINDVSEIVVHALKLPGVDAADIQSQGKTLYPDVTVGFGHATVLGIADKVLDAVKRGDIQRFIVMGGCDGSEKERSYYTEMAKRLPKDTVILTMGCAKYRFNKLPSMGTIPSLGIPRVLDMGQCNDSISGVKIALGLAK